MQMLIDKLKNIECHIMIRHALMTNFLRQKCDYLDEPLHLSWYNWVQIPWQIFLRRPSFDEDGKQRRNGIVKQQTPFRSAHSQKNTINSSIKKNTRHNVAKLDQSISRISVLLLLHFSFWLFCGETIQLDTYIVLKILIMIWWTDVWIPRNWTFYKARKQRNFNILFKEFTERQHTPKQVDSSNPTT